MAEPIPGWLAGQFEHWRPHLASVAYAMLGSVSEAEDAVQQAFGRLRAHVCRSTRAGDRILTGASSGHRLIP
jgi:DNA-directed RNA polymerase specialized sigma24 family protein